MTDPTTTPSMLMAISGQIGGLDAKVTALSAWAQEQSRQLAAHDTRIKTLELEGARGKGAASVWHVVSGALGSALTIGFSWYMKK